MDNFNYASIDSMKVNGWSQCGQGPNQFYNVTIGYLTVQDGAAMCHGNVPAGVGNWTVLMQGRWAYNVSESSGVQLLVQTSNHSYKFVAGASPGSPLVVYRDGVSIISGGGFYGYCKVDGVSCFYSDFNVTHTYRLTMVGGLLTAYFDDFIDQRSVVGSYTEPDASTSLVMVSPGSGSDIGVVWSYVTAEMFEPTSTFVSCSPSSVRVDQISVCSATVTDVSGNHFAPTGSVRFSVNGPIGTCTLAPAGSASSVCSVNYIEANCPCYDFQASPGTYVITGAYAGDTAHQGSSASSSVIVTPLAETAVSVSCIPSAIVVNQSTKCTGTVIDTSSSPTTPTGKISWGGVTECNLGSASASSSSCSDNVTGTQDGSITVAASYEGDTYHYRNDNGTGIPVGRRSTSTIVSCSPGTIGNNTASICTATVKDTDIGTPITPGPWNQGDVVSVRFSSNSTGTFSSSSCTLNSTSTVGVARCSVSYTPTVSGHHLLTGSFQTLDHWGLWDQGDYFHNTSSGTAQIVLDPSDPTVTINSTIQFQGVTVKSSGSLSIASGTVSGTITVVASNSTSGATLFSKTYTITGLSSSNGRVLFLLRVPVAPYPLSVGVVLSGSLTTWHAQLVVTRNVDILGRGSNDIIDLGIISAAFGSRAGSSSYNPAADLAGSGSVDIVDATIAAFFFGAREYS